MKQRSRLKTSGTFDIMLIIGLVNAIPFAIAQVSCNPAIQCCGYNRDGSSYTLDNNTFQTSTTQSMSSPEGYNIGYD